MSSYSEGQTHQLMDSLEVAGFTPADVTALGQFPKLAQIKGVVRGELVISKPVRRWRKENGVIYFDATFDGTSGPDWIVRLEKGGKRIGDCARSILLSSDFKPTKVGTAKIAVLPGEFFTDDSRITENIRAKADVCKWGKPNVDLGCVVREMFTDEEIEAMGLWLIVAMHEPILDSDGCPDLLGARRNDDGPWLYAYYGEPGRRWDRGHGFAFAVTQVSS